MEKVNGKIIIGQRKYYINYYLIISYINYWNKLDNILHLQWTIKLMNNMAIGINDID